MGRASGERAQVATGGFDVVMGARRGPATEQERARRAAQEHAARLAQYEAEKDAFLRAVDDTGIADEDTLALGRLLLEHYEHGIYAPEHPGHERFLAFLRAQCDSSTRDMPALIRAGDPPSMPGLTAPVVKALTQRLADPEFWEKPGALAAESAVRWLMQTRRPEFYARIPGICDALGRLIPTAPDIQLGPQFCEQARSAMANAPTQTLNGPLRPWFGAFAQRIADHAETLTDRQLETFALMAHVPEIADAYAPLRELIAARL